MASIKWAELKNEYILGDYKSLNSFAEAKGLKRNGNFNKATKGWTEERATKGQQKSNKIVSKTIEKVAEKESNRNARILSLSDKLADKLETAIDQLELYIVTNKKKTKTIDYAVGGLKPIKEIIVEEEIIDTIDGIIDKQSLKTLSATLKDIKDIQTIAKLDDGNSEGNLDALLNAIHKSGDKK